MELAGSCERSMGCWRAGRVTIRSWQTYCGC